MTEDKTMQALVRDARKAQRDERSARARHESCIQELRARGASWAFIGAVCGTSKSAAFQRFAGRELR